MVSGFWRFMPWSILKSSAARCHNDPTNPVFLLEDEKDRRRTAIMTSRIDTTKHLNSGLGHAMLTLSHESSKALDPTLFALIEVRASQINGCAYCIDMHTKDARAAGETEQRLYALNAWRETPFFSERERAALEWTEELTRVADTHASD